jgi:hypothetical protein
VSPENEGRDEVEAQLGGAQKDLLLSMILFYLVTDHKKIGHELIFFSSSLEGSIMLVKSAKVYFLTLNGHLAIFDFDICHTCTWATLLFRFFRGFFFVDIDSLLNFV